MKIGVLLATYNGESYLREQLDSILSQSVLVDEIVISDDGSSDNTITIINEYVNNCKRVPIKFVINQGKHGVIHNFNNAFKNSMSDLLFFCDQDDVWKKNKVAVFLEAVKKYPQCGLFFSNATLTDSKLKPIGQVLWDIFYADRTIHSKFQLLNGDKIVRRLSYGGNIVTGMSSAASRNVLENVFPLNPAVLHDEMIACYCSINGGIVAINEETAFYRQHSQNVVGLGSMFIANDRRRNSIKGIIKNSDQNMAVINSAYYKSMLFLSFDKLNKYFFLVGRFRFFKEKYDIAVCNKLVASLKMIKLGLSGKYRINDLKPLKGFILDLAMIFFVKTKKRREYFKENNFEKKITNNE